VTEDKHPPGRPPKPVEEHLPCAKCQGPMTKRAKESHTGFARRQFCSNKCAGKYKVKPEREHPPCAYQGCGRPVLRRSNEGFTRYHLRRCCSPECAQEISVKGSSEWFARRRQGLGEWPDITGSNMSGQPFAAFDRDPGDGGRMRVPRPATFVATEATS
jgi:hypothetical protein